ncbi:hypothetical protein EDB84DRAFT_680629 [Lactarius hengduanensis]|nr:hypothetical protein EDB84DRAFT_680629 [Lactarius hengduanensis]
MHPNQTQKPNCWQRREGKQRLRVTCYSEGLNYTSRSQPTFASTKMASVAPSRLAALARLRSVIFQTSYNPTSQRTGAKYLKRRLRGPSMMDYYPQHSLSLLSTRSLKG